MWDWYITVDLWAYLQNHIRVLEKVPKNQRKSKSNFQKCRQSKTHNLSSKLKSTREHFQTPEHYSDLKNMGPCPNSAWGQLALTQTIPESNLEISKDHPQKVIFLQQEPCWVFCASSVPQSQRMACGTFNVLMQPQPQSLSMSKTSYLRHLII